MSETGYDPSDPKHPTFHDRYADVWDNRDKVYDAEEGWIDPELLAEERDDKHTLAE